VCAWVGNQRSHGVVTAQVRTDAVRGLHHQRRDLHQSTYPIPLRRLGLILLLSSLLETSSISACKEGRTIKQDHVIKKEEFEERIRTWLMFKASWSKEDGPTSFWTFLVVTLLALTSGRGAAAWGTRFCLEANFEESGWLSSMIFDVGGAFLQKRITGAARR
jgi:hypothetical protein